MAPEQRYLSDVTGDLYIEGAVKREALKAAQAAVDEGWKRRSIFQKRSVLLYPQGLDYACRISHLNGGKRNGNESVSCLYCWVWSNGWYN